MISRVSSNIGSLLQVAALCSQDLSPFLEQAAVEAVSEVKQRIGRGIGSDGQSMISSSSPKTGAYSKDYGNKRGKAGLPTGRVDLRFSGKTMDSYGIIERGQNYVVGGFDNNEAGDIADYNEQMFGQAYYLSDEEINKADVFITKQVADLLSA